MKEWVAFLKQRPGFQVGANVPYEKPRERELTAEELEEAARINREWIMRGVKSDSK